jgi:hypothetical protein
LDEALLEDQVKNSKAAEKAADLQAKHADKMRIENQKLREEKLRQMEIHRQRVMALEEAEYKIYDETRAKAADEL